MPEVKPFFGFRFDQEKVDKLDATITPPYDVITPEERSMLAQASPYSMVHLMLPQPQGDRDAYTVAGDLFAQWINDGILRQDDEECVYLLEQTFSDTFGREHVRRGFFALTKLPEVGERVVLGHEHTFSNVVGDRFKLYETTRGNLEPVFALYADPENKMTSLFAPMDVTSPDLEAHSMDGVTQRLWRVPCPAHALDFFKDKLLYIADGHHRFRTACEYRDAMREREHPTTLQPYDYVMMGFVSMSDPGLLVYPTHRLMAAPDNFDLAQFLKALEPWFEIEPVKSDLPRHLQEEQSCAIGITVGGRVTLPPGGGTEGGKYLLKLRESRRDDLLNGLAPALKALDVEVLHRGIIERVLGLAADTPMAYERDADKAIDSVQRNEHDMAFLLKACTTEQIRACADANEAMPHKSTYFFPKLPSGTVLYRH